MLFFRMLCIGNFSEIFVFFCKKIFFIVKLGVLDINGHIKSREHIGARGFSVNFLDSINVGRIRLF